jgi:hypothetical protein
MSASAAVENSSDLVFTPCADPFAVTSVFKVELGRWTVVAKGLALPGKKRGCTTGNAVTVAHRTK